MDIESTVATAPMDVDTPPAIRDQTHAEKQDALGIISQPTAARVLTPPTSEDMDKREDNDSSDLSDLDMDDEDIGDIEPDHYFDDGAIPVFKPVCFPYLQLCVPRYKMQSRTNATPDHGSIPRFQEVRRQNQQIWHEVGYCQDYSPQRMVRVTPRC
jgi:hypothetical protein